MTIDERLKKKTTGLVVRIGFQTLKGGLIKEFLLREADQYDVVTQGYYFVGGMILLAFLGFIGTIPSFIKHHFTLEATILRFLDLVTTAVPPALPSVLISGLIYSIERLRQKDIYCISPYGLHLSGIIKTVVFDKTGTLTDSSIEVLGHRSVIRTFKNEVRYSCLEDDIKIPLHDSDSFISDNQQVHIRYAMACCQSTKRIGDKLIGNPHDIKIFEYIGWE